MNGGNFDLLCPRCYQYFQMRDDRSSLKSKTMALFNEALKSL